MIGFGRRWPRAARVSAALALACGLAAFGVLRAYAIRVEAAHPALGPPIPVVVAAVDLTRGATLAADALDVIEIPEGFAPPKAIADPDTAVGRVLVSAIAAGEPITPTRLAAERAGPVAGLVPPGLRAFVVATEIPASAIRAGDRVDILTTFGGGRPHTETTATGLEVLSVLDAGETDALSGSATQGPRLVLLVSPDTAERLAYASAFGDLSVTIASADEVSSAAVFPPASASG